MRIMKGILFLCGFGINILFAVIAIYGAVRLSLSFGVDPVFNSIIGISTVLILGTIRSSMNFFSRSTPTVVLQIVTLLTRLGWIIVTILFAEVVDQMAGHRDGYGLFLIFFLLVLVNLPMFVIECSLCFPRVRAAWSRSLAELNGVVE